MQKTSLSLATFLFFSGPLHAVNDPTGGGASPAGPKTIALQWVDNSADETSFEIQRHNGDNNWAALATLDPNTSHYYDRSGLTEQTTWHYRVRSVENANNSGWLDLGSATTTITMNILFFFSDDMGYKDIVALRNEAIDGPTIYETPAVDSLVSQGLTITNAYCSGPKCVVARRSVQTGKYDWRPEAVPPNDYYIDHDGGFIGGGIYGGGTTVAGSESGAGVTIPDNVTYGEAVKAAGYRTCFIGKYHLGESSPTLHTPTGYSFGDQPGRGPIHQGYDVSIASGHAGAPPGSYFAQVNQNTGAGGAYTFELPDLDDTSYMLTPAAPADGDYLNDRLTAKAIGFMDDAITNHSTSPFHLTLAHYAVHTPVEAKNNANSVDGKGYEYFQSKKNSMHSSGDFGATHPAGASALELDYGSYDRKWQDNPVYAAMMKSYDDSLAELRAYLAATDDPRYPTKKLSETTIIVLTSDHGGKSTVASEDNKSVEAVDGSDEVNPDPVWLGTEYRAAYGNAYTSYPTSNFPYRHGKTWSYEGGLKIPLVVYFPGVTTPGSTSDAFVHQADFFSTFCDMAGASQQPSESTDSVSFALSCGQPEITARDEMHHFFTNANRGTGNPAMAAYRHGDYKLVYFIVQRRYELYNLAADPYERVDLSIGRPDLAEQMLHEIYQQYLSTGAKIPKPGSNSWNQEQDVLTLNNIIGSLPAVPSSPAGLTVSQSAEGKPSLSWTEGSGSTYSVIYRSGPVERFNSSGDTGGNDNYREVGFVPAGTTTWVDDSPIYDPAGNGTNKLNLYKYRVESENIGGWAPGNTGNKTLTITDPGAAAATATADAATTVPGENLRINPLLNDMGVGTLTISSITQPTAGSATSDGQYVYYSAPEDFSGSVTLTYTIEATNGQTDTATITINLPVAPANLNALEAWEFDDANGTDLDDLTNSGSLGSQWRFNSTATTNGSGQFVVAGDSGTTNRKLPERGTANAQAGADIYATPLTGGKYRLLIDFASWNVDAASAGDDLTFHVLDSTETTIGRIDLRCNAATVHFRFSGIGGNFRDSANFNLIEAGANSVAIDLDFDNDTIDYIVNGSTIHTFAFTASDIGQLKFVKTGSWATAATSVSIEKLQLIKFEAAATLYDSWADAFAWNGVLSKGSNDDPDGDGIDNLMEFAFGLDPLVNNPRPTPSITVGTPSTISFTPYRNTSLLNYTVEFSDNLSVWDSYTPFTVATPAGQAVNVDLPTGNRIFTRVNISTP